MATEHGSAGSLPCSLAWLRSVNWLRLGVGLLLLTGVVCAYIEFDASKLQQGLLWVQENKTKGWIIFLVRGASVVEAWIV